VVNDAVADSLKTVFDPGIVFSSLLDFARFYRLSWPKSITQMGETRQPKVLPIEPLRRNTLAIEYRPTMPNTNSKARS